MTFHAFITQKYPLFSDKDMKVNLTVGQIVELVEEYVSQVSLKSGHRKTFTERLDEELKKQQPFYDVRSVEPEKGCGNCNWFSGVGYSFCHYHGKMVTAADLCDCYERINLNNKKIKL